MVILHHSGRETLSLSELSAVVDRGRVHGIRSHGLNQIPWTLQPPCSDPSLVSNFLIYSLIPRTLRGGDVFLLFWICQRQRIHCLMYMYNTMHELYIDIYIFIFLSIYIINHTCSKNSCYVVSVLEFQMFSKMRKTKPTSLNKLFLAHF